ncbi:hypothetical protein Bca4012_045035 [Brassica carinata]
MTRDRVWCPISSDHNTSQHIKTATVVASPLPREIKLEPSSLLRHGYNLRRSLIQASSTPTSAIVFHSS